MKNIVVSAVGSAALVSPWVVPPFGNKDDYEHDLFFSLFFNLKNEVILYLLILNSFIFIKILYSLYYSEKHIWWNIIDIFSIHSNRANTIISGWPASNLIRKGSIHIWYVNKMSIHIRIWFVKLKSKSRQIH